MAQAELGDGAWPMLVRDAGVSTTNYLPVGEYPDADVVKLVGLFATRTRREPQAVLESFGAFIVPDLLDMYGHLLRPSWRTLDVVEHTEETIHRVVRARDSAAKPPELKVARDGDSLVVTYTSQRRLCSVAVGIIRGIARHFGDPIEIDQSTCMLRGDDKCSIVVKRVTSARPGTTS